MGFNDRDIVALSGLIVSYQFFILFIYSFKGLMLWEDVTQIEVDFGVLGQELKPHSLMVKILLSESFYLYYY